MSFRVRVTQRDLSTGKVSIWAANVIMSALRIALRAEASSFSARRSSRGRLSRSVRESIAMSLVAVEPGSGVLVFESDAPSPDVPSRTFEGLACEAGRTGDYDKGNLALQRALLSLECLFQKDSDVESVEFIADNGRRGVVNSQTILRLRESVGDQLIEAPGDYQEEILGRLLELDLSVKTFRLHSGLEETATIEFADAFEPLVRDALNRFVTANVVVSEEGRRELVSIDTLEGVPDSQFHVSRTLAQVAAEQHIRPINDFRTVALDDPEAVPIDEFTSFLRAARQGE